MVTLEFARIRTLSLKFKRLSVCRSVGLSVCLSVCLSALCVYTLE